MTTTTTRTVPTALILGAMENAGTMAQTAARNMQRGSGAGCDRYELACRLTDALGYDCFGVWRIDDANTSADDGYSVEARRHAAQRRDWRTRLSNQIAKLDDAAFAQLIAVLADGRGPEEAARWRDAAGMKLRAFADGLRNDAIDAGDGYDVAS